MNQNLNYNSIKMRGNWKKIGKKRRMKRKKKPGDREEAQAGREIGVSEDQRVLWECRNPNPWLWCVALGV